MSAGQQQPGKAPPCRRAASERRKLKACLWPQSLLNQLRAIFDQIIEFQSAQDALYRSALEELALRLQYEDRKRQREEEVRTGGGGAGGGASSQCGFSRRYRGSGR